ncbi:TadA family conjugal transfer-associated ATPase [Actinospica robiniae]|uniref:TadA family conjugal transfer-associated ATPase n=1 Tax=Actinospica robiniae TaxID=304901 RepID=UPI0004115FD8|nr:TadA family conjugal transfer-associated ATPase [Actinospica robiniae]
MNPQPQPQPQPQSQPQSQSPAFGSSGGVLSALHAQLAAGKLAPEPAAVRAALIEQRCTLGPEGLDALARAVCDQFLGSDPIAALLRDPEVTDVLINGPGTSWVERAGRLEPVENGFVDEAAVRRYAQRLAVQAGRRLDDASPYVDVRLPDGSRMHAILPPLAVEGTTISLRTSRRRAFSLAELHEMGTVNELCVALLAEIVAKRVSFLVTGGAGTGKTTLLSALLSLVEPTERLVLVEDCSELTPSHPHVIRLEARPANQEGRGEVGVRDLVRQALRMRPNRIILGEARGAEIMDLFTALNTGHEGGCGTLHANRPQDVPARIEALALMAGVSREAVHSQAAAAVRLLLHLERDSCGRRRLQSIAVLRRRPGTGPLQAALALSFDESGKVRDWPGLGQLEEELGRVDGAQPAPRQTRSAPTDFPRAIAQEFSGRDRPYIHRSGMYQPTADRHGEA